MDKKVKKQCTGGLRVKCQKMTYSEEGLCGHHNQKAQIGHKQSVKVQKEKRKTESQLKKVLKTNLKQALENQLK